MKKETERIRKIPVPIGFSGYSKSAIEIAAMIAERFSAVVVLVNVLTSWAT